MSTALLSSRLTKIRPALSATANSGRPPSSIVLTIAPLVASIAVADLLPPLNVNTRPEAGS